MRKHADLQFHEEMGTAGWRARKLHAKRTKGRASHKARACKINARCGRRQETDQTTRTDCAFARICSTKNEMRHRASRRARARHSLLEFRAQFTNSNYLGDFRDAFSFHLKHSELNASQAGARDRTRSLYTRWGSLTMRHTSPLAGKREYGSSMRT